MISEPLYQIADDFSAHGGRLLILDEIHKINHFASHIKAMYDFTAITSDLFSFFCYFDRAYMRLYWYT
jgi:hypothetical protein